MAEVEVRGVHRVAEKVLLIYLSYIQLADALGRTYDPRKSYATKLALLEESSSIKRGGLEYKYCNRTLWYSRGVGRLCVQLYSFQF
jgi:hypothetical protein